MTNKSDSALVIPVLTGDSVILRPITLSDANETYLSWMQDPAVNQYLESRFQPQTMETLRAYVQSIVGNKDYRMFAILAKEDGRHVGNIKLGPIVREHERAAIGIVIGDRNSSGKGYATEAIKLVRDYAFNDLKLRKVHAGCYFPNKGSIRAFEKAGFMHEGVFISHSKAGSEYIDCAIMADFADKSLKR